MTVRVKLLSNEEYKELSKKGAKDFHNVNYFMKPGYAYYNPWYWDLDSKSDNIRVKNLGILSIHYFETWSKIRPPITVFCPNNREWCIDQKSRNGTGWIVTGTVDNITCSPSIVVPGYHGFLQSHCFTPDLDGNKYDENGKVI